MTVIVKIEPVSIVLKNGWEAKVTGIDLFSGDPFNGEVHHVPTGDGKNVRWMYDGKVRDNCKSLDLDMSIIDMKKVTKAAELLGAKMYP